MVTAEQIRKDEAEPSNIVIFGATGDLCKRKLMPALLRMFRCGLVHPDSRIIGVTHNRTQEEWLDIIGDGLKRFSPEVQDDPAQWDFIRSRMVHVDGDYDKDETYGYLAEQIIEIEGNRNAMFYCAIPPGLYGMVARGLNSAGLNEEHDGYRRLVIEKPFGRDLETACKLDNELQAVFKEDQIYRIDHYLGKESVQNLLVYRFANTIMEPLWNRNYIDHIQISASESLGIENRAKYYERAGAMRDMVQSHLMQVMTLVAMEPPVEFKADAVRDEKMKVLRAVRRFDPDSIDDLTVSAQYTKGTMDDGEEAASYVKEEGVAPDSTTETFAAVKFYIDNWRWQGVPFIVSSGKRMKEKASEVVIRFRQPPFNLFDSHATVPDHNTLVFRFQPEGRVSIKLNAKKPGLTTDNQVLVLRAPYADNSAEIADAYEILMHDVLMGDGTLFSRADEVEESWAIVEPILDAWEDRVSISRYRAGSNVIPEMDDLCADCIGGWFQKPKDKND